MPKVTKPGAKRGATRRRAISQEPLFICGDYRLFDVPGRNFEIRWDVPGKRNGERVSAGTRDLEAAKEEVLRLFHGGRFCKACGQPVKRADDENSDLISAIFEKYIILHAKPSTTPVSIIARLKLVEDYIGGKPVRVGQIDETWIRDFRKWAGDINNGYWVGAGKTRRQKARKPATIEGSVAQLGAAIRFVGHKPRFRAIQLNKFDNSPDFRADVPLIAAMFRYCLSPKGGRTDKENLRIRKRRESLLYFLRLSVATWGRPEAVCEANLSPSKKQWISDARVFRLNPADRKQNSKHRPTVPVPELVADWLDSLPAGPIMPKQPSRTAWVAMMNELKPGLGEGEGGMKLIRRSMAKLALDRLGLDNELQIQKMMGHHQFKVTDVYTLPHPGLLGRVLAFTTDVVNEIEALAPGAFAHNLHTTSSNVLAMNG